MQPLAFGRGCCRSWSKVKSDAVRPSKTTLSGSLSVVCTLLRSARMTMAARVRDRAEGRFWLCRCCKDDGADTRAVSLGW